jgi:HEPN domain-containing protein
MNRSDFQKLAELRIKDAEILLTRKAYSGAYYLAGYSVECALKACVAKQTKQYDFPPHRKIIEKIYTHEIGGLVKSAELETQLDKVKKENKSFETNWAIVKDWTEESRYKEYNQKEAEDLISAISNSQNGVLQWLKLHW